MFTREGDSFDRLRGFDNYVPMVNVFRSDEGETIPSIALVESNVDVFNLESLLAQRLSWESHLIRLTAEHPHSVMFEGFPTLLTTKLEVDVLVYRTE